MKAKTINKEITKNVNLWLDSLPVELKDKIKNKIVVTGGSIASMFLQEPVNDYDMYFTDIKTAILVTQHYCQKWIEDNELARINNKKFSTIRPVLRLSFNEDGAGNELPEKLVTLFNKDTSKCFNNTSKIVVDPYDEGLESLLEIKSKWSQVCRVEIFIKSEGFLGNNPDEDSDDVQISFTEGEEVEGEYDVTQVIEEENTYGKRDQGKYETVFMSANAITLTDKIQLVIRFFGEPSEIHDTYDFIHATNYWTSKGGLHTNTKALQALLSRELVYSGSKYPLASIFRTRKFIMRDWNCHVGNYVKMAMQLNEFDLCDPTVLEEQLTGVDAAYLHQIIRAIKDKRKDDENFQFNAAYICELADRLMGV